MSARTPARAPAPPSGSAASSVRRPPPALRGAPGSRGRVASAAKAHVSVSLVFAHGDAVQAEGSSASEEALSRQLDRDTAGERMSLRSRRSSVATLASMRTEYSSHPLSQPLPEEDEPVAGPSRLPSHFDPTSSAALPDSVEEDHDQPSTPRIRRRRASSRSPTYLVPERRRSDSIDEVPDGRHTPQQQRPNPKQSGAWLRWNSPAPAFPKRDKGKARDESPNTAPDVETVSLSDTGRETRTTSVDRPHPPPSSAVPAPPTPATHGDECTVSALIPSQPLSTSHLSTMKRCASPETTMNDEPPRPEPRTPEPAAPDKQTEPPPKPTPGGWRAYFWGSSGDAASTQAASTSKAGSQQLAPPNLAAAVTDPAAELALAKVESRASTANGSANGTVKRRKVDSTTGSIVRAGASSAGPSAPPSPRALVAADPRPTASTSKTNAAGSKTPLTSKDTGASSSKATESAPAGSPTSAAVVLSAPPPVEGSLLPPAEITATPKRPSAESERPTTPSTSKTERSASTAAAPAQGWGTYLSSWVYPSAAPTAQNSAAATETAASVDEEQTSTAMKLANPAEDQKPVAEEGAPSTATPNVSDVELPPADPPGTAPPSPPQPKLATSHASTSGSTSGWLSYLAFRHTQKKITASTKTLDDTRSEEVMDFENDPDFPPSKEGSLSRTTGAALSREASRSKATGAALSRQVSVSKGAPPGKATGASLSRQTSLTQLAAPGKQTKGKADSIKGVEERRDSAAAASVQSQPAQKLGHKRSQNLASGPHRRLSNASSTRSAASTPQPSSPRPQGNGHSTKGSSDLPGPPKTAAKQTNFIIPTFDITFDRPPRSLLPRHSEPSGATGVALRALSYVYNTQPVDPPEEKRGKKEGRDVGANLPRKIGLDGGSPDDGWKDVRRVVVIGVHGWFPAKMLTSVIGEPTGTSSKFANMMGQAVRKFFAEKGVDENELRLTLIPLEGEGTIDHRVDKLYKQYLSNPAWINDLRRADAVLFAAHSQGCIVTTHLISRMIAQGHLRTPLNREAVARCEWAFGPIGIVPSEDSKKGRQLVARMLGRDGGRQKVAMLAMCGVHLGPFYSISTSNVIQPYLHWFENAAAKELFEFQDSTSAVSVAYQRALAMILENEVRILLLSSLNDQVVPIYGASFATASHPLLLRALYVDGASYSASDFMTNLLCFAFMLRNAGIDDQRLIEHLSEATAGSLTGVGHSTPYEELGCYTLAVQYLFHCGPAAQPLPPLEIEPFAARDARNDYELPWIMRALVDSPQVKDLFPDELRTLKDNILAWKPNTKALKEIKKRLEPMAGRQRLSPLSQLARSASDTSLAAASTPPTPGVQPGTAHAQSHANTAKKKAPPPKAVMTMVGR